MSDMRAALVTNEFVKSEKFEELFAMLNEAALKEGVELVRSSNAECFEKLGLSDYEEHSLGDYDFILFWDKDVRLAGELERIGYRVFNSAEAIAACDDKSITYMRLKKAGVRQPLSFISPKKFHSDGLLPEAFLRSAGRKLSYPLVFKEVFGSFGDRVYLINDEEELFERARITGERAYMLQEFIESSKGRDIRLQVAGDKVCAAMLRYNDGDFRANITNGGSMKPYTPSEDEVKMALEACRALNLSFAGVDILFGEDGPFLCEVNSNAHFKNLYDCTGINAAEHIIAHLRKICS